MDFNEHYILHWDFFKDVNKEADEEFFINLTLKKLRNKIDKEEITIDFNFDGKPNTTEQYLNKQKKESFFFDKEYIKVLEQKLKLLEATEEEKTTENNNMNIEKNLDKMINIYDAYVCNCEFNFIWNRPDKIEKYSRDLYKMEIFNISHRAFNEIKELVFNDNIHSKNIVNYYFTKCSEILKENDRIIEENNLNHCKIMPTFIDYFDTMQFLYEFYDNVIMLFPWLEVSEVKTDKVKIPQKDTNEIQKEDFTFENNFDDIDPKDVYEHFKAGLVDGKYINEKTLREFLNTAFNNYEESNPPNKKIRMENTSNSIGIIRKIFFEYYSKQIFKSGKKEKYVRLLSDYFSDFDYGKTHANFR